VKTEDAHCGWAWGTQYAGKEKAMGIDELGYLSAEGLLEEVLRRYYFIPYISYIPNISHLKVDICIHRKEEGDGIDELGYLSAEGLLEEVPRIDNVYYICSIYRCIVPRIDFICHRCSIYRYTGGGY